MLETAIISTAVGGIVLQWDKARELVIVIWNWCISNSIGLVLAPLFLALGIGVLIYRSKYGKMEKLKKDFACILIIMVAVYTSLQAIGSDVRIISTKNWRLIISPALSFPVLVLIKVLIGFWLYYMIFSLLNSDRVSESHLKIFGIEMTQKMEKLPLDIDNLSRWTDRLGEEINFLDNAHGEFMEFLLERYEGILDAAIKPASFRQLMADLLTRIYYQRSPGEEFQINVVPLTEAGFSALDNKMASLVRTFDTGETSIYGSHRNLGVCFYRSENHDWDTAIIIQGPEGHWFFRVEIVAVGTFFVSLAKSVESRLAV